MKIANDDVSRPPLVHSLKLKQIFSTFAPPDSPQKHLASFILPNAYSHQTVIGVVIFSVALVAVYVWRHRKKGALGRPVGGRVK